MKSGCSSQTFTNVEDKLHRDIKHLQEQLQSTNQTSITEQQINEFQQTIRLKIIKKMKLLTEKDEIIVESQTDLNYPKDQLDQNRLIELQQKFNSIVISINNANDDDYIHLNQQQHEQLQKRYQEKDIYFEQLTQDRVYLQNKLS
ncbi:unnamed protein product [Rotaria sordida]|uniref:Uncharacterized protein n=2 Tax=Rotaria sordida TaxID=392033 RepID=A0A815W2L7_9BILA|nr:unnamed protein product [Rotaria sordida]CAF1539623.1 unnamed protein product [Rotaria sordida]